MLWQRGKATETVGWWQNVAAVAYWEKWAPCAVVGPYGIIWRVVQNDYVIDMGGMENNLNGTMLLKYHDRVRLICHRLV